MGKNKNTEEIIKEEETKVSKKRGIRAGTVFWTVFIGLAVIVLLIHLVHRSFFSGKMKDIGIEKIFQYTHNKIFEKLSERNSRVLSDARLRSIPQINAIKENNILEIREQTAQKLEEYFKKVEGENIEEFLDWVYSIFTDYVILYDKAKDIVSYVRAGDKCVSGDKRDCARKIQDIYTNGRSDEKYLQSKVDEYLFKREEFSEFMNNQILPFWNIKIKEFIEKAFRVFKENYRSELKSEALSINPGLSEEEVDWITENFMATQFSSIEVNIKAKPLMHIAGAGSVVMIGEIILKKIVAKFSGEVIEKAAAKAVAKVVEKGAVKVFGGGAGGFLGGLSFCSPGGPFAIICGVVGGIIGFIATDYAITKLDEFINRDDMKRELITELEKTKSKMLDELVKIYEDKYLYPQFGKMFLEDSIKLKDLAK